MRKSCNIVYFLILLFEHFSRQMLKMLNFYNTFIRTKVMIETFNITLSYNQNQLKKTNCILMIEPVLE